MNTFRKHLIGTLLVMMAGAAQCAWAQTSVTTGVDLSDGSTWTLSEDLTLTIGRIDINGITVTIDLNGHKLTRPMTAAADGGQVIAVLNGGKLKIIDSSGNNSGQITGGWAYEGGAIFVDKDSELTISGGTITGNRADKKDDGYGYGGAIDNHGIVTIKGGVITGNTASQFGGAIHNEGTLIIDGGTIRDNNAGTYGGGIYSNNTANISFTTLSGNTALLGGGAICTEGNTVLHEVTITGNIAGTYGGGIYMFKSTTSPGTVEMSGDCTITGNTAQTGGGIYMTDRNNPTLKMKDKPVVKDNTHNDVYLQSYQLITLTGRLNAGASVGVFTEVQQDNFTYGYRAYENNADPGTFFHVGSDRFAGNIGWDSGNSEAKLTLTGHRYIERAWDKNAKKVTETTKDCTSYTAINGNNTGDDGWLGLYDGWYVVTGNSSYKTLNVLGTDVHLLIPDGVTLTLTGGVKLEEGKKLSIYSQGSNGGTLIVTNSYSGAAGIGSAKVESAEKVAGELVIHGGTINVTGGEYGAGIGGGQGNNMFGNHGGTFILYGGTVTTLGGEGAAGVGGGYGYTNPTGGAGGVVNIYGGTLNATGGSSGAGIGGGKYGGGASVEVSGGEVHAQGGTYAAGIGGGEYSRGSLFRITGGTVYAKGAPGAAGIGGGDGDYGYGGQNHILGGTVVAEAGTQGGTGNRAFGPGDNINWENDPHFSFEIANEMRVCAGNEGSSNLTYFSVSERVEACKFRSYARVEPCPHDGVTQYTIELDQHTGNCTYCNLQAGGSHVLVDGKCQVCGAVILNDNSDNSSILSSNNGTACPAVFLSGRTFWKNETWHTLCLPFALNSLAGTPLEGATVKTLESASLADGTLTLNFSEDATAIEAGKPYIVKWSSGVTDDNPKFENVTLTNALNNVVAANTVDGAESIITFCGTLSPYVIEGEDRSLLYLGASNTLYYPNAAMTIGSSRAFFQLNGITAGNPPTGQQAGIKAFKLNFDSDDDPTGIISVQDSQFTVNDSDAWYTLDGRKLSGKPTAKGIYINNGKKVMF